MQDTGGGTYKLELDTPLESFLKVLAGAALVVALIFVAIGYVGGRTSPPDPRFITWSAYPFGLAICAFALYTTADCYYLLDPARKQVDYHFEFFSYETVRPYLLAEDMAAVTLRCVRKQNKHHRWYEYRVVIVDGRGRVHPVSDSLKNGYGHQVSLRRAEEVAEQLGVPFVACGEQEVLVVDRSYGNPEVRHVPESEAPFTIQALGLLVLFLLPVVAIGLVALAGSGR